MKASPKMTMPERAGRIFGRAYRAAMRREAQVVQWLVGKGLPIPGAKAILWIIKLAVIGVLLYVAFWLALLLIFIVGAAWIARNADFSGDDEQPEWRNGWDGYGLYRGGVRIDVGDSGDE